MEGAKVWSAIASMQQDEYIMAVDASVRRGRTYKITPKGLLWLGRKAITKKGSTGIITPLTYRQQIMRDILEANERAYPDSKTAGGRCPDIDGRTRARNSGASKLRLRMRKKDTDVGSVAGAENVSDDCGVV